MTGRERLNFSPIGFEPMDANWWPAASDAITRPWPKEAVLFDLRWWRGQEMATAKVGAKRRAKMPGRPALCQRWGWMDWDARKVMREEAEWRDDWTNHSSNPPAPLQRSSSVPPAVATANADNRAESSSVPPAILQQSSSVPPHARLITVSPSHRSPDTKDQEIGAVAPARDLHPKPPKPTKPPKPKAWGYPEAVTAWTDEHARIIGTVYPWQWTGHNADPARVKVWIDAARVTEADLDGGIARIRGAVRAYLEAVDAGTAWPLGDPASTRHFTREIAKWLQTAPGRPAPAARPTKTESLLRHIQKRLQESANAE